MFRTYNEAHDYCLEQAQKWDYVVAVKYLDEPLKETAKIRKLREQCLELKNKHAELKKELNTNLSNNVLKVKPFFSCRHCKSRVNTEFVRFSQCPVCGKNLLTKTDQNRLQRLIDKIQKLDEQIAIEKQKQIDKAMKKKNKKTEWLVAGWGAC